MKVIHFAPTIYFFRAAIYSVYMQAVRENNRSETYREVNLQGFRLSRVKALKMSRTRNNRKKWDRNLFRTTNQIAYLTIFLEHLFCFKNHRILLSKKRTKSSCGSNATWSTKSTTILLHNSLSQLPHSTGFSILN